MRFLVAKRVLAILNYQISISLYFNTFNTNHRQKLVLLFIILWSGAQHSLFISLIALDQSDLKLYFQKICYKKICLSILTLTEFLKLVLLFKRLFFFVL